MTHLIKKGVIHVVEIELKMMKTSCKHSHVAVALAKAHVGHTD